jgi:hypothetical protein
MASKMVSDGGGGGRIETVNILGSRGGGKVRPLEGLRPRKGRTDWMSNVFCKA